MTTELNSTVIPSKVSIAIKKKMTIATMNTAHIWIAQIIIHTVSAAGMIQDKDAKNRKKMLTISSMNATRITVIKISRIACLIIRVN